jgi:hypothetical protein
MYPSVVGCEEIPYAATARGGRRPRITHIGLQAFSWVGRTRTIAYVVDHANVRDPSSWNSCLAPIACRAPAATRSRC